MIRDFSHVTVCCVDIERSISFYEAIGLMVERRLGEMDSRSIARAFALPRARLSVAHLRPTGAAGSMCIDLVQWIDPVPAGAPYPTLNHLGLTRLAFHVVDIDSTVAVLRARGASFLSAAIESFGRGVRSIAFTDPDGTTLQLVEGLAELEATLA